MKKLTIDEFWSIKRQIDVLVIRLGWSKQFCKDYIKENYGRSSRLSMTDEELVEFLGYLRSFCSTKNIPPVSNTRRKKRRRRGI